jgi:hypothetical protein
MIITLVGASETSAGLIDRYWPADVALAGRNPANVALAARKETAVSQFDDGLGSLGINQSRKASWLRVCR